MISKAVSKLQNTDSSTTNVIAVGNRLKPISSKHYDPAEFCHVLHEPGETLRFFAEQTN